LGGIVEGLCRIVEGLYGIVEGLYRIVEGLCNAVFAASALAAVYLVETSSIFAFAAVFLQKNENQPPETRCDSRHTLA
jgi:hypothetical protein